jgi:DNA-binding transcriptional LysR family regulator
MDRLASMGLVLEVAQSGSLSAAARKLRMPLASLSRKVSELEHHLGAQIFKRTSRKLALTDSGEGYLAAARRILDDISEAERTMAGEFRTPSGELVVTAPVVFGRMHVLPVATAFLKSHPDIDLRLILTDQPLNLAEEHVDVALRIGPLPDSQMRARLVGNTRRIVCASPAYLAVRGQPKTPADLASHDGITLDSLASAAGWQFRDGKRDVTVPVRPRLKVNSPPAAIDAAIAELGLTRVLSYQVATACRRGDLQIVLEQFEPEPWPIHLVHMAQGPIALKVRAFLDWAAPELKARLLTD